MARIILNDQSLVSVSPMRQSGLKTGYLQGPVLASRLRQARSKSYVDAMTRLDAGVHHQNKAKVDEVVAAISAEFPELVIEQMPQGLVSRCYLGAPYEVHICDLAGSIIEHFENYRHMPPTYERARQLATHPQYAFIEIYADCVRAVSNDGSVSVISA